MDQTGQVWIPARVCSILKRQFDLPFVPRTTYSDPLGHSRTWESAERRTRPSNSLVDGVTIIAILEKTNGPEILLQKQFRPPVNKICIEVPAGLIDEGESLEKCALRELKEETGYVGTVVKEAAAISPLMFNGRLSHGVGFTWTHHYIRAHRSRILQHEHPSGARYH